MPARRDNIFGIQRDKSLSEAQVRAIIRDELENLAGEGAIDVLTMYGDVIGQSVGAEITTAIDNGVIELNNFAGSVLTYVLARANHTGTQLKATISDLEALAAGTYAPTVTGVANVAAITAPYGFQYLRVGSIVTVSGMLSVTPTAAADTLTTFTVSLPAASNLGAYGDCSGAGATLISPGRAVTVSADTATDQAACWFYSNYTIAGFVPVTFTYRVI